MANRRKERGGLEADVIASTAVPLERELIVSYDEGKIRVGDGANTPANLPVVGGSGGAGQVILLLVCTDRFTAIPVAANIYSMHSPVAFTISEVQASLEGVAASSGTFTVDINNGGGSILSTKLTIDAGESTSITAATPAVISNGNISKGDVISIDIDNAADGTASGLIITLIGT